MRTKLKTAEAIGSALPESRQQATPRSPGNIPRGIVDSPLPGSSSDTQATNHRSDKMRFLSMIRINEKNGQKPSEQLLADMGRLMEEMTAAGVLLDTAGLRPTSEGVRVRLSGGKTSVVDGPFTEAKEVIGGYAMLKADSLDEAIELARRFLLVHGEEWELDCEVRQVAEHCD
jgi:hypothetical protein